MSIFERVRLYLKARKAGNALAAEAKSHGVTVAIAVWKGVRALAGTYAAIAGALLLQSFLTFLTDEKLISGVLLKVWDPSTVLYVVPVLAAIGASGRNYLAHRHDRDDKEG